MLKLYIMFISCTLNDTSVPEIHNTTNKKRIDRICLTIKAIKDQLKLPTTTTKNYI